MKIRSIWVKGLYLIFYHINAYTCNGSTRLLSWSSCTIHANQSSPTTNSRNMEKVFETRPFFIYLYVEWVSNWIVHHSVSISWSSINWFLLNATFVMLKQVQIDLSWSLPSIDHGVTFDCRQSDDYQRQPMTIVLNTIQSRINNEFEYLLLKQILIDLSWRFRVLIMIWMDKWVDDDQTKRNIIIVVVSLLATILLINHAFIQFVLNLYVFRCI